MKVIPSPSEVSGEESIRAGKINFVLQRPKGFLLGLTASFGMTSLSVMGGA